MIFKLIKFHAFNSFVELRFRINFNPECVNSLQNINMFNVVYKFILYMYELDILLTQLLLIDLLG